MLGFTTTILVARLVFKQFFSVQKRLNAEDWTIMTAAPIGITTVFVSIYGLTRNGLGVDLWGLQPKQLISFGRYFYIMEILYLTLIAVIKLTLTFFYLNIFAGSGIRILLWVTVAVHVLTWLSFTVGVVFQCLPIAYQWEKYDFSRGHPISGRCIDINAAGWANGALSVASDLWLLALPLSQISKLRLPWKKRLGATLMFMTGTL